MALMNKLTMAATMLAVAGGLIELYLVATSGARTGHVNAVGAVMVFVMPMVMIAGGVLLGRGNEVLGAGLVLVSIGIQHFMVEITKPYILPFGLAVLAIVLSIYAEQTKRRMVESRAY